MNRPRVDISNKPSPHSFGNKAARVLWAIVYVTLFRPSPRPMRRWRIALLRLFGAKVSWSAKVNPRVRIWGPWNLHMGDHATLGDDVDCYCVASINIGAHTTVSQYCYLCAATHDFEDPRFPLRTQPIEIASDCWLAAGVFVGPGVNIGEGAVVGARSSVFKDLPPWTVCHGSPAKAIRPRVLREADATEGGAA